MMADFDWEWRGAVFGPGRITDATGNAWHLPIYHEFPKEMGGWRMLSGIRRAMFELRGPVACRWIAPEVEPDTLNLSLEQSFKVSEFHPLVIEFLPFEYKFRFDHGYVVQFATDADADAFAGRLAAIKYRIQMEEQNDPPHRF